MCVRVVRSPPSILLVDVNRTPLGPTFAQYSFDTQTALLGQGTTQFYGRLGTKESLPCSNRGYCDQSTGICQCYTGFVTGDGNLGPGTRGDCGFAVDPITACPGIVECSGHGVCSDYPLYKCSCEAGWTSGDCSQKTCPVSFDWFALPTANEKGHFSKSECSNKGLCDRSTGRCQCQDMFEGEACERSALQAFLRLAAWCAYGARACVCSDLPWRGRAMQWPRSVSAHE